MVKEHIDARDWILGDRNDQFWGEHKEMNIEDGLRMEFAKLQNMLKISIIIIMVIVAITFTT